MYRNDVSLNVFQDDLGMESGIIYVLNIGMKHIDTNLRIGFVDMLGFVC